jgi:D-alanine-D-alanine ligase
MGPILRLRVVVLHNRDFNDETSPEYESSADVEKAAVDVLEALESRGHQVVKVAIEDPALQCLWRAMERFMADPPDIVFNLCESLAGDVRHEVVVPALLDLARIPYTGSEALGLSIALQKDRTKAALAAHGIPTPAWRLFAPHLARSAKEIDLPFPLIVKPSREDASVGIDRNSVVHTERELSRKVAEVVERFRQPALVERFIEGREIYVSLVGNETPEALPMHEIDFLGLPMEFPRIVSYAGKWHTDSDEWRFTRPVRADHLSEVEVQRLEDVALAAFRALELRDYARVDLRLGTDGVPYVIDVNPNCDLSNGAGVSRAAALANWTYPELIERIVLTALRRYEVKKGVV